MIDWGALAFVTVMALGAAEAESPSALTVVTYNIHHGEGTDGKLDLERIAKILEPADIIALQEVDRHFGERSGNEDQARWLAERLRYHYVYAANLDLAGGEAPQNRRQYGVAVLSRYPIEFSRNYPLRKRPGNEQRGLLEVQIAVPKRKLRLFVTHLTIAASERVEQVQHLLEIIGQSTAAGPPHGGGNLSESMILTGDFNFRPSSKEYQQITVNEPQRFVDAWKLKGEGSGASIGAKGLGASRIDYLWLSPDLETKLRSVWMVESPASDHLPIFAELDW